MGTSTSREDMQFVRPAIRSALASRALRSAPAAALRPVVASQAAPSWIALSRAYSAGAGLSKDGIQERIFEVIKSFEKVDPSKVSAGASFTNDLGLDSLDAVEVVMAVEEEFAIEIPDEEADKITTVGEAIDYIAHTPEAR